MKTIFAAALAGSLALGAGTAQAQSADLITQVVNGVGAKLACSGVFVSGRSLDAASGDPATLLGPLGQGVEYEVSAESGSVSARRGGVVRTAFHRPGLGCTLSSDGTPPRPQADPRAAGERDLPWTVAAPGDETDATALQAALDAVFPADPGVDTRAFLVIHNGRIVAERYAPGFDADTRLLGWSMGKSVTATLIGLLIEDGRLNLADVVTMPGWAADDPRQAITLEHLLHMSSGLAFTEDYSGADDATLMLFTRPDMAAYAASKPLEHSPGEVFFYSSGTTLILSRLLVETLGSPEAVQAFARERLFVPAGMTGAVMEQDEAGTPVGSSYVYGTARDWARFGQLYLDEGQVAGRRVLPAAWTAYVRRPAPAAAQQNYGAQFWLNGYRDAERTTRVFADLPTDAFYASGANSQSVLVIPSLDVVVVRLGWTTGQARFRLNAVVPPVLRALGVMPTAPVS